VGWIHLTHCSPMAVSLKHDRPNKQSTGYIKQESFLDQPSDYQLLKQCYMSLVSRRSWLHGTWRFIIKALYLSNSVGPELAGSSYLQEPAAGPYPEPTESYPILNSTPPANIPKIHSDPNLPSTLWTSKRSLSSGFPTEPLDQMEATAVVQIITSHFLNLNITLPSTFGSSLC
jgi:hypothetical protein